MGSAQLTSTQHEAALFWPLWALRLPPLRLRLSPRLLPIPTTTAATALDMVVCMAATDLDTAMELSTASLRLSPRLLLIPTTTAAMVDMVLATGATEDTEVT